MTDLSVALAAEAVSYATAGETLRHKPSGLNVRVLTRYLDCIYCEFPKGAKINIALAMLEALAPEATPDA